MIAAMPPSAKANLGPIYCPTSPTIGPPIGVDPAKATAHRAMTLPRISGEVSVCKVTLPKEAKHTAKNPTADNRTTAENNVGASEAIKVKNPKRNVI